MMDLINPFKKIPIVVRFSVNEIEVYRADIDKRIRRKATRSFSTERLVIADFHNAELELSALIKDFLGGRKLLASRLLFVVQQMVQFPDGVSEVEKRAYRDLAEHAGAVEVYIVDHSRNISLDEIRSLQKGV